MRTLLFCCVVISSVSLAQVPTCLNVTPKIQNISRVPPNQANTLQALRLAKRSPYEPAFSVSNLVLGGEGTTVPGFGVSYVPRENAAGKFVVSGGFVWRLSNGTNGINPRFPLVRQSSVYSEVGYTASTAPGLGVGYLGAEYRYYLLRGEIQPYVGIGARALGGIYSSRWGMALAPHGLAGLNLQISHVFNGFVELQHAPGIGLTFGGLDSFRGLTTIAFGFSFVPQFARW
ncbi:MAG TPA: hypothetical protein VNL36_08985 [Bacteroidota bacterium]|nr:hypothetical protein [Bacteroidota bacterium]